jgi:transcriptional antiterminator RfaH
MIMEQWYAIYTKPKCEESTALLLDRAGIDTLSPKIRIRKYLRKKYTEVIEQLFPSYIFANFDCEKQTHMIKYTRGVRYIVGKEHPIVVPAEIISAIRERLNEGIVTLVGDRVVIREGPFKDFYGIFERNLPGRQRAMILLDALHCKVDIESTSIRKA